jgi:purine nucleosidase
MRRVLGGLLAFAALAAARETIVFDTDCGLFGDDGASLVMLLRSPVKVSIADITVVPGNVWSPQGAEYVHHILDLLKRSMMVYTGAATPLLHTAAMAREEGRRWGPLEFSGAFALDPHAVVPAPGARLTGRQARPGAVERIIAEVERHPGDITIFAVGPLTNIALALRLHPEIETRIKQIVMMGGNVGSPGNASPLAEFNFWFDAEAARLVLRSRIPKKILFDLDICNRALLRKPQFDEIVAAHTPVTDLFREDYGNRYPGFLQHPDASVPLWDVLCAAWLLDPASVTRSEPRYLDVRSSWGRYYGATIPLDRRQAPDATPVTLMLDLDYQRVYKMFRDLLIEKE